MAKNYKSIAQYRKKEALYASRQNTRPHIPKAIREKVLNRYDGKCAYCGCTPLKLSIDHREPFIGGQNDSEDNLMPACYPCNNFKSIFTLEQFRAEISAQAERARKYSVNFRMGEKFGLIIERKREVRFYFEIVLAELRT